MAEVSPVSAHSCSTDHGATDTLTPSHSLCWRSDRGPETCPQALDTSPLNSVPNTWRQRPALKCQRGLQASLLNSDHDCPAMSFVSCPQGLMVFPEYLCKES